jgi:PGF-pre-PGF domain-containing protein
MNGAASESVTIGDISAGSSGTATFGTDHSMIQRVTVEVKNNASNVQVVLKAASAPTATNSKNKDYECFDITATNLVESNIQWIKIRFKVEKTWLSSNHISENKVALYRYVGGSWTKLDTIQQDSDDNYAYYEATSPGFSLYSIAGETSSFLQLPWTSVSWTGYAPLLMLAFGGAGATYAGTRWIKIRKIKKRSTEDLPPPVNMREEELDESVLRYIKSNKGVLSLSGAAKDLAIPPALIKEAVQRLKRDSRLGLST